MRRSIGEHEAFHRPGGIAEPVLPKDPVVRARDLNDKAAARNGEFEHVPRNPRSELDRVEPAVTHRIIVVLIRYRVAAIAQVEHVGVVAWTTNDGVVAPIALETVVTPVIVETIITEPANEHIRIAGAVKRRRGDERVWKAGEIAVGQLRGGYPGEAQQEACVAQVLCRRWREVHQRVLAFLNREDLTFKPFGHSYCEAVAGVPRTEIHDGVDTVAKRPVGHEHAVGVGVVRTGKAAGIEP